MPIPEREDRGGDLGDASPEPDVQVGPRRRSFPSEGRNQPGSDLGLQVEVLVKPDLK